MCPVLAVYIPITQHKRYQIASTFLVDACLQLGRSLRATPRNSMATALFSFAIHSGCSTKSHFNEWLLGGDICASAIKHMQILFAHY